MIVGKKILGSKAFWAQHNPWSKIFLVQQIFDPKNCTSQKFQVPKIWGQNDLGPKNPTNFGGKKFWSYKVFGQEKFCPKNCCPKKIWPQKSGSKKFGKIAVKDSGDIADMDKCHQVKSCTNKCHPD